MERWQTGAAGLFAWRDTQNSFYLVEPSGFNLSIFRALADKNMEILWKEFDEAPFGSKSFQVLSLQLYWDFSPVNVSVLRCLIVLHASSLQERV